MNGPYQLNEVNVRALSENPGVYVLGFGQNNLGVYVGRSDDNLRNRVWQHLPQNETQPCLKTASPTHFWVEYKQTARAAYDGECSIYHQQNYRCNLAHPAKTYLSWTCPVCGQ